MTLKGNYAAGTTYAVGDVVKYTDGVIYILHKACVAGTKPTNTLYWQRLQQYLYEAVSLIMDAVALQDAKVANNLTTTASGKVLDARKGKDLKDMIDLVNPDSKTIRLLSSTASSTKLFDITVNDSGEISATEYTPAT